MNIFQIMTKMLYFLPKKSRKLIRCYEIYMHGDDKKMKMTQNVAL